MDISLRLKNRAKKHREGQSLVELLIAVVVGTIMILGAMAIITPALRSHTDVNRVQVSIALGKGLLDSVKVFAESDWHNITNMSTGSTNHYHLTTSSPFSALAGDETIAISTSTYIRYFYLDDVYRDAMDEIVSASSGNSYDPSTKAVIVGYRYSGTPVNTITSYVARNRGRVLLQTDWSGGAGQDGPATTTNSKFSTSSNIHFTTTTGSVIIDLE